MHQRTWLSLLTLPLVATFTYPVVFRQPANAPALEQRSGSQDPLAGLSDIQDVLALIRDNYVEPPDLDKVIAGGIQAALERAHPFNSYISPEELRLPDPGPATVGLQVMKRQIYAQVVAVEEGGPAAAAGFQVGDVIRKVDGESIGSMSAWSLERRLRGPAGSEVALLRYAASDGDLKKISLKREPPRKAQISVRKDPKATLVDLPDLTAGRWQELQKLLPTLDRGLPLVLDLRACSGGTLQEAAQVAGLLASPGPLATVQETGKPDQALSIPSLGTAPFPRLAVIQGPGTCGPAEALSAALKAQGVPIFGERTAALGVERSRFLLKQGGAAELVTRRWIGAGGEFLGAGGDKPERTRPEKGGAAPAPKPTGYGVAPNHPLKGLKPGEDPLPRILEGLDAKAKAALLPAAALPGGREGGGALLSRGVPGPKGEVV